LATTSADRTVRLWHVADPADVPEPVALAERRLRAFGVAFSPDSRFLVDGGDDRTARVWDLGHPGEPILAETITINPAKVVLGVAVSSDSRVLATTHDDGSMRLWDLTAPPTSLRAPLATITGHSAQVRGVAFSPRGRLLATASED
nr:WD40 repeat domain-containing protein [Micromonospora sp. DSM 115978]